MINRNYAEDSRLCQRIKFDQALYILTMYQKKIRKSPALISQGAIDADTEMQDIVNSWKSKWKNDLTKPILNCVTSVHPRILIDLRKQEHAPLDNYNSTLSHFLTRFRTEYQDETNFKMVIQQYDHQVEFLSNDKYVAASKATVKGFLLMANSISDMMITRLMANYEIVTDQMLDVNTDNLEWQVLRPLRYIRQVARRALTGDQDQMDVESDVQPKCQITQSLIAFCNNTVKMMERIKESEHGSTLITVQPKIDQLTLLIHPLLMAIGANFKKENHEKVKDYDWSKIDVESIPMMQNVKGSFNYSRVAFVNLDGYQSEFNLQFARNFKKHLLYASFPKQEAKLDSLKQIYSNRFFKKLMFRYSQSLYQTFSDSHMSEDYKTLSRIQRLTFNPEEYHTHIQKLYQQKNDKLNEDFNQNIFVFPIRMSLMYEKFKDIMQNKEDIENHESYFVRFMIRDFLLNQIRQFNPTLILISYSGRIHIEDHHFVQIIQEFTKIANYKLLFYPNLTTAFVDQEKAQAEDPQSGETCEYDNYTADPRITLPLTQTGLEENPNSSDHWIELFNKAARFLKVSSGTYNLNRSFQEEPLVGKYKNQFILRYIDELMTAMGKEYPNIQKIRFKNKDLSILPKLFQENIKSIKKTFEHTVPKLYFDIYNILEYLLLQKPNKTVSKREQLLKEYQLVPQHYQELIDRLRDDILQKSNYQVTVINVESMGEELEKEKFRKMKEVFCTLKESHLFQISSQKFQQSINIYFKTASENKQFTSVTEQTESIKGLFETTFYLSGKVNLKLYDSTRILYKIDQTQRTCQKIPLLIMNNLTDGNSQQSFQNYYSQVDIANSVTGGDKKAFEEKKCLASPLVFLDEQGRVDPPHKLFILADWNYHQTQQYLMLFWPSKYDFLQAFLLKLMNKPYRAAILNDFYLMRKGDKNNTFRKVNINSLHEIPARIGTSCYSTHGKVYIFGGFYEGEKNYLQLQHDIVVADLQAYDQGGHLKLPIDNIKHQLYSMQTFDERLTRQQKPNSFVRPRMQFQFFERGQIFADSTEIEDDSLQKVIMFGGYGQNFMRPYSLLTYYYYTLTFHRTARSLQSIERKIIYNKAIPINTRQMTKNLGVIKTNRKTKNSMIEPNKLTDPSAYTLYRNTFRIDSKDGQEDFNYKIKYMFSEEESRNFKHEIKKIHQLKAEDFDSTSVSIERDPKNNHLLTIQKEGKKKMVTLRMQLPQEMVKRVEGHPKEVTLTHESIVCLDIYTSMICAIVKHQKYTQGKSILVEYNTKLIQNLNFDQDIVHHLVLSCVKEFDCDLTLHNLIICNKQTYAILHGQKLTSQSEVKEFILKRKKNKPDLFCFQIQEREKAMRKNEESNLINTVFFRHRNKIMAIDIISLEDSYQLYINCQEIQLNSPNDAYRWTASHFDKFDPNFRYQFCFSQKNFVRMQQLKLLEYLKKDNQHHLVVEYSRRRFICEVSRHSRTLELMEEEKCKMDMQNVERGIILNKTQDKYIDRQFM